MKEWIGSIILFAIFAGIFEAVLPQDGIKKYVRLILGIFLIVIVLEPWIGADWEVSLSAMGETSVSEVETVPVMEAITEQYDYYITEALRDRVEGEGIYIEEARCILSEEGRLQTVSVVCVPESEDWVVLTLDLGQQREEIDQRLSELTEHFEDMLQADVVIEWRT